MSIWLSDEFISSTGEVEEETEEEQEEVDWHAILVADFEYSDPSEEEISSGDEIDSEDEEEDIGYSRLPLGKC